MVPAAHVSPTYYPSNRTCTGGRRGGRGWIAKRTTDMPFRQTLIVCQVACRRKRRTLTHPVEQQLQSFAFPRQHRSPTVFAEFGGFQNNQASGRFRPIDSTPANQTNDGVVIRFRISAV